MIRKTSTARISREMNRLLSRTISKIRPRTSTRSPRSAASTWAWAVGAPDVEMVVSAMVLSVGLAHAAHEPVADEVQGAGEEEEDDADEVEAGDGQAGAPHAVGAGGERGHGGRHGQAALERVALEAGGVGRAAGDEHDHRLADGPGDRQDHRGD